MTTTRKFVKELPPDGRGRYDRDPHPDHLKIIKMLRRKPGKWVELRSFNHRSSASRYVQGIRDGRFVAFRQDPGQYEGHQRDKTVFARYVGEKS